MASLKRTIEIDAPALQHGEQRLEVTVEGLNCAGNTASLAARIRRHVAVYAAALNPVMERAFVRFDPEVSTPEAVFRALERELGPGVRRGAARWRIGLAEVGSEPWARRVEHEVTALIGVRSASLERHTMSLTIEFAPSQARLADVQAALAQALGGGSLQDHETEQVQKEVKTA